MGLRRALTVALSAVLGVGGTLVAATPADAATLDTDNYRASPGDIVSGTVYDYAPTLMQDGVYRMWWCGATEAPGDNIMYSESSSLNGPFHARGSGAPWQVVFKGPNDGVSFDSIHTCDPSIVRVNGTYYMYYGGLGSGPSDQTKIGVARSSDGLSWTRLNNGQPIIVPANKKDTGNNYGAGQPSVIYLDGLYYLVYTDTTGADSPSTTGNSVYVLRSPDPLFQQNVEELTASGFAPRTDQNHTSYALLNTASVDWQFIDALNVFAVANDGPNPNTLVHFFNKDLLSRPYDDVVVDGAWAEGPGIVSRPDKHAVPPPNKDCGTIPFDIVHATRFNPAPAGLKHFGLDLLPGQTCASVPSRVPAIYEGYGIQVSGLPLTLVVNGKRLQAASSAPIADLTKNFIEVTNEAFHYVPFGASLPLGATVLGADGRPPGFLLDNNTLWPVSHIKVITDNGSAITYVSPAEWDSHPVGPALYLVQ